MLPVTPPPARPHSKRKSDDDDEEDWFLKQRQQDQDHIDDDDDDHPAPHPSSTLEILGSMLPFGAPNLGSRRLMAVDSSAGGYNNNHHHRKPHVAKHGKKRRNTSSSPTIRYLDVTESVYYATLNHTEPRMIRLFAHQIVQKCSQASAGREFSCFPHYNTQSNSSKPTFGGIL